MTPELEKKIEEAAKRYSGLDEIPDLDYKNLYTRVDMYHAYLRGAKFPETKEYWQKGMYTEDYIRTCISKVYMGMGFTSLASMLLRMITGKKDYSHRDLPNLYTEEEVKELFINRSKKFSTSVEPFNAILLKQDLDWFEQNKKKD